MRDVRRRIEIAGFLRERRGLLVPTQDELRAHTRRRVAGLTRREVAARAGVSLTWYSWLEMGRDVHVAEPTLRSIARALNLNGDETTYLLALAASSHPALPLGQTGDIDDATLSRVVDGFTLGPAFVVDRRWNVVASNGAARDMYGFVPSNAITQNIAYRLLRDPALRGVHEAPDAMLESVVSLVRYNYADDPENTELTQWVNALAGDERFARVWKRYAVGTFAPEHVVIRLASATLRFVFIALSVGRLGHQTLVLHLPESENPNSTNTNTSGSST